MPNITLYLDDGDYFDFRGLPKQQQADIREEIREKVKEHLKKTKTIKKTE